jgi:type IV pilus assembly protein PilQ
MKKHMVVFAACSIFLLLGSYSRADNATETLQGGAPQTAPAPVVTEKKPASLLSVDFKDADIIDVLNIISQKAGVNIVPDSGVKGTITVKLDNVSWEKALDVILKIEGLASEREGDIIMVSTLEGLTAKHKLERELQDIQPVITRVVKLKFLDAQDAKKLIEPQLSTQGKVSILEMTGQKGWAFGGATSTSSLEKRERVERQNTRSKILVITDVPAYIDRIENILKEIDIKPRQVLIEAKIMEVNKDVLRDLGVDWGTGTAGAATATGFEQQGIVHINESPASTNLMDAGGHTLSGLVTPSVFNPESTGLTAANAGLEFVLRRLNWFQFQMIVKALEEDVRTNTLSAPRILTLSGQEATILVGTKYPILSTQVSGTDATTTTTSLDYYENIGIQLNVVPQISGDRFIDMIVHPAVSTSSTTIGTNQYPVIQIREAETQVVMEDNETIVIGGLLKDVKAKSQIGVPFLSKIPVLGMLFTRNTTDLEKIDLLIFIHARILKPGEFTEEQVQELVQKYSQSPEIKQLKAAKKTRQEHVAPQSREAAPSNKGYVYKKD